MTPMPDRTCELLPVPRHIGIIMDGNGRWAKSRGLPRAEGHRRGVENVLAILDAGAELGVETLTLYAFSVENWKRPAEEVAALMGLLEHFLDAHADRLDARETRLRVAGDIAALPEGPRRALERVMARTARHTRRTLCLAINYGSRTEVLEAVRSYARDVAEGREKPAELTWESFSDRLYTRGLPDPDLIIRTSGEMRMSNFLLLQAAYAEMYFTPVPWPEFTPERLAEAVNLYRRRERRFGLTGDQVRAAEAPSVP